MDQHPVPRRVVSLLASATEIVVALGCGERLVGRSHECDYPPWVRRLPQVTEPAIPVDLSSRGIHEAVRRQKERRALEALSIFRVHTERLLALRPDLLLTQDQCAVCAVSLDDVQEALAGLLDFRPQIVSLHPEDWRSVLEDFRRVGRALGVPERGEALARAMEECLESLRARTADLPRPTVAVLEWLDPVIPASNWIPTLVEAAGGVPLFRERKPWSEDQILSFLREADPDFVVCMPCGFSLERSLQEAHLLRRPPFTALRASREGRLWLVEANQLFTRPGPRLRESATLLAQILHPERFGSPPPDLAVAVADQ